MGYAANDTLQGSRSEMRFPTSFRAIIHWDGNFAFVRVADAANGGFRVIGDFLPETGGRVRIGATSLNEPARVAWRTDNACGLVLDQPIDALRVIRSNCFRHGRHRLDKDAPLGHIQRNVLAESLLDTFSDDESALAFLRGDNSRSRSYRRL